MAMTQEWVDHGQRWRRVLAAHEERFILGADLGQASDPTALCVLHWQKIPTSTWKTERGPNLNINTQQVEQRFDVVDLERIRLETPYPQIVGYVGELLARPPLRDGCDLVIDDTGVGRAVSDIFEQAGMRPQRITITSGNEVINAGSGRWHVPKGQLVSTLDAKLHCGELRFAKNLAESGALSDELRDFQRSVSAAGRSTYSARSGRHDDLVLAVAIAAWWAAQHKHHCWTSTVEGLH
jgi:hypothetical protein